MVKFEFHSLFLVVKGAKIQKKTGINSIFPRIYVKIVKNKPIIKVSNGSFSYLVLYGLFFYTKNRTYVCMEVFK